jgi:hypothetical protein
MGSLLAEIPKNLFASMWLLKSICIPSSVEVLRQYCFSLCIRLVSVHFESVSRIRQIESFAFSGCQALRRIFFPISIRIIEPFAFRSWSSLEEVGFEGDVSTVQVHISAFDKCRLLGQTDYCDRMQLVSEPSSGVLLNDSAYFVGEDQAFIDSLLL